MSRRWRPGDSASRGHGPPLKRDGPIPQTWKSAWMMQSSRPAGERPSDEVSDHRHEQRRTSADIHGQSSQARGAAALTVRACTWLRDEEAKTATRAQTVATVIASAGSPVHPCQSSAHGLVADMADGGKRLPGHDCFTAARSSAANGTPPAEKTGGRGAVPGSSGGGWCAGTG